MMMRIALILLCANPSEEASGWAYLRRERYGDDRRA